MNKSKYFGALLVMLFAVASLSAQKFGYVNSQQLLQESPEVKAADTQMETYQKSLMTKGETMVKELEADYNKYMQEASGKTLSPVQMQQREADLTAQQQAIQKYEQEVQEKIYIKREQLLKPIIDKINTAIEAVGKEGGYTMIFDTSTGALLHATESEDVINLVKAKL